MDSTNTSTRNVALTRRAFVTGALGAGLVAFAGMSALSQTAPAQAQESSAAQDGPDYDIVIIGAGGAG